jgi:transposase
MDEESITDAARSFGLSRVAFYYAQQEYRKNGLAGLLPSKRGPKRPHKLTQEVMAFIDEHLKIMYDGPDWEEISRKIEAKFCLKIHPRSIMRAIKNKKKSK